MRAVHAAASPPLEISWVLRVGLWFPRRFDRRLVDPQPPFTTAVNRTRFRLEGCNMKLILEGTHPAHCPDCGSASIHRSRRRDFVESILHYALFISPYRCDECYERHFRFRSTNVSSTRPRSGKDTPPKPRLADQHLWAAVVGSMVLPISVTLVAGKPLSSAWRWMRASSLAR